MQSAKHSTLLQCVIVLHLLAKRLPLTNEEAQNISQDLSLAKLNDGAGLSEQAAQPWTERNRRQAGRNIPLGAASPVWGHFDETATRYFAGCAFLTCSQLVATHSTKPCIGCKRWDNHALGSDVFGPLRKLTRTQTEASIRPSRTGRPRPFASS